MKRIKRKRFVPDLNIPKGAVVTLHSGKFNRVVVKGELTAGGGPDLFIGTLEVHDGAKVGTRGRMLRCKADNVTVPFPEKEDKWPMNQRRR